MSPEYRPEIDGLRAISVLAVVLFHAELGPFAGGFAGVDIFFLISGYLITSIIVRQLDAGGFSLLHFYERRVRRILPALLLVMACMLPAAWLLMLPGQLAIFGKDIVATGSFLANWYYIARIGYFDAGIELRPLIHTWSLGVEEQFYLLYPLLVMTVAKFARNWLAMALLIITAASLAFATYASQAYPDYAFYSLPTRGWELTLGGLIAVGGDRLAALSRFKQAWSLAGLGLVIGSLVALSEQSRFPGYWALLPVGGAGLLVAFADRETLAGRLLAIRPLVWIGLVSYSAYLWHQPLLVFMRMYFYQGFGPWHGALALLLTLLLSAASWRFVERPFRSATAVPFARLAVSLVLLTGILAAFAGAVIMQHGAPRRMPAEVNRILAQAAAERAENRHCLFGASKPYRLEDICKSTGPSGLVAIWGDSHASAIARGLDPALAHRGAGLERFTTGNCLPVLGYAWRRYRHDCRRINREVLADILADDKIGVVVLVGRFTLHVERSSFDNGEGGREAGIPGEPAFDPVYASAASPLQAALTDTIDRLQAGGKKVLLVYPMPEVGWAVPEYLARRFIATGSAGGDLSTDRATVLKRGSRTHILLDTLKTREPIFRVDPARLLCDTYIAGRCAAAVAGRPLYFDDDHPSLDGARPVGEAIAGELARHGLVR